MRTMTEESAKNTWCPFSRTIINPLGDAFVAGNRSVLWLGENGQACFDQQTSCLGVDCMAWIWASDENEEDKGRCGLVPGART